MYVCMYVYIYICIIYIIIMQLRLVILLLIIRACADAAWASSQQIQHSLRATETMLAETIW